MNDSSIHDQQKFVDFLSKLSPSGETLLLVRQKPKVKDGQIELHPDGAVKAVWPAFLPSKRIGADWAVYANTASFIVDRFPDGKPSAAAANCEYVLVMVLDDVGDPDKAPNIPPLEPTWKMETSPGSFQWGYVFSEQPSKGEFSAAIRAVAEAGYTDPGACNPVRNFRIPGSVNLKPNKAGAVARLVEFEPTREYTLDEICTALGVTPAPADTAEYRPIRVADDGADDVVQWLSQQGLVLSHANPQGWMGVVCPNSAEHTDGNPEGRYNPSMRAYCCLHSHCLDLDSSTFLGWVADQGGPKHDPGLRDELLATLHSQTLSKLAPTAAFPDAAAQVIAEVERKELGRVQKADWYGRFAYIQDDDAYFDMVDRTEVSRSAFNALYRHITCKSIHTGRRIEASVCFDENRQANGAPAIRGMTYAAGEGVLVTLDGDVFGNRWRNARPDVSASIAASGSDAAIQPWLAHAARLVPDLQERNHILDVMAYKVQYPEVKINHAVLHGGTQGCGKDTLWAPFLWAVCGEHGRNKGLVDGDTINSQWGYALESEVMVLNELREPEAKERRALANRLKPIIAAPPDMLPINRKGLHPYMMLNRLLVIAFTNDRAPISLESSDRRWFCLWSEAERMNADDARALWAWYQGGGFTAIASWLHARDVSRFNPAATPKVTDFKMSMIEDGRSMAEEYLIDLLEREIGEFALGMISAPFHMLRDRIAGNAPTGVKIPQAALLHALAEAGWRNLGRVASRKHKTPKQTYISPRIARAMADGSISKSDIRDAVEGTPVPNVVKIR
jgi:hypothetical protein